MGQYTEKPNRCRIIWKNQNWYRRQYLINQNNRKKRRKTRQHQIFEPSDKWEDTGNSVIMDPWWIHQRSRSMMGPWCFDGCMVEWIYSTVVDPWRIHDKWRVHYWYFDGCMMDLWCRDESMMCPGWVHGTVMDPWYRDGSLMDPW